jgi:hypothetical protein
MARMTDSKRKRIMRSFYRLNRPVTDDELKLEIASLKAHDARGALDDFSESLFIALRLDREKPERTTDDKAI